MKNKKDVIMIAIITVITLIGLFQIFFYESLKAKCNGLEKQLAEKDAAILDLRALLGKEKAEFKKFKSAMAEQVKEILDKNKKLDGWLFHVRLWGWKLRNEWDKCTNYCNSRIVPWTLNAVEKFKKLDKEIKTGLNKLSIPAKTEAEK